MADMTSPAAEGAACRNYDGMTIHLPISVADFQRLRPELLEKGKGHCVQKVNGGHAACISAANNGVLKGSPDCGNKPGMGAGQGAAGSGQDSGDMGGLDGGYGGSEGNDDFVPPPPANDGADQGAGGSAGAGSGSGSSSGGDQANMGMGEKPNWQCCITDNLNNPDVNGILQEIRELDEISNGNA